jgi:ATP-dependent Clp protease protease subunit
VEHMNPQTPQVVAQASPASMGGLDEQVYSRLLRERIIFLAGQVEDNMANAICAQILLLAAEDTEKDIYLYINSPGGSITAGMAIYDTMQFVKNDVATVAMGMAASMGQFLLTAGAPGKRYALPNARILMHQPLGGIGGTATDIRIQAENMAAIKKKMAELIAHHTGQSVEKITADSDRDRWFTAEEAKEYGFVDQIAQSEGQVSGNAGKAK